MYRSQVLPIYSHSTLSFGEYLLIPRYCQGFWGFISKQGGQSPILLFKNTPLQKFFCFWLYCATCKILASWPVIKPGPWQQKCQVLTFFLLTSWECRHIPILKTLGWSNQRPQGDSRTAHEHFHLQYWWRVTDFLQKWAGKDLTKDHISADKTQLCGQGAAGGALWHHHLGPPPTPNPELGVTHQKWPVAGS